MILVCLNCASDMDELLPDFFRCPCCGFQAEQLAIKNDLVITPKVYKTAEKNGISKAHLEERVKRYGWNQEDAANKPIRKKVKHGDWPKRAEQNGIPKGTFYQRIKWGWTYERAVLEPVDKKRRPDIHKSL